MTKWLGAILLLVGAVTALTAASILPIETSYGYLSESGPIELATAYLWFTLALVLLVLAASRHALLFLAFVSALAGARELDAQSGFTSEAVTNMRYWTRDVAPVSEKIVAAVVIALVLSVFVLAIRRHWRDVAGALVAGHGWAWSLATVILATPVLMFADGTARYYRDLTGSKLDPAVRILSVALEETWEMMLPVIGLIALGQYLERLGSDLGSGESKSAQVPQEPEGT